MTERSFDSGQRRIWLGYGLASCSIGLAIVISGVYANAMVWADEGDVRVVCGTAWEASANTATCASALKQRAWVSVGLLGLAMFGALLAVFVPAGQRSGHHRPAAALALVVGVLVVVAGLLWAGAIDRGIGP